MKHKHSALVGLFLTLSMPLLADAELKLPQSQDDYRQLTQTSAPCRLCGIVTDVHSARRESGQRPTATSAAPGAGISNEVGTTPIIGSGGVVKDARQAKKPLTTYKITVRYTDGTYAFFEQDEQPVVQKGDRVEVTEGRVVPRAAD